ncbi:EGF domain-specific O-linked N-acetylglucosamine transferase-like, partial [Stegodyphus dumicola]|uniref:EGF domain-specific O-linked N-acetylglucosamine transferase-like n=1 Tax=Stegodyphus dumicola TaxID=202533 RepID=UPI0015B120D3
MKFCFLSLFILCIICHIWTEDVKSEDYELSLPPEHMAYYFTSHPAASNACKESDHCPYKNFIGLNKCWGYEKNCAVNQRFSVPVCNRSSKGWAKSKQEQTDTFFKQGDFGYIRERMDEIIPICTSKHKNGTFFECAKYMRFCRGKHIMFDFKTLLELPEPM